MNMNTKFGQGSLANTNGTDNSAFGHFALNSNTTAICNVGVGSNALLQNTTGSFNSAIGAGSMCFNELGSRNTAVGSNALEGQQFNNSVGNLNVAVGVQALFKNSDSYSTAVGTFALMENTAAQPPVIYDPNVPSLLFSGNTATGYASLQKNTTGFFNTANGVISMSNNVIGYQNVAMGAAAMENNITGFDNTAIGAAAMRNNTLGENNTAIGAASLERNTTGFHNVGLGPATLRYNQTGNDNTSVGYHALRDSTNGSYNTALGFEAGLQDTLGSYNTYIGYKTGATSNNFVSSTAIGHNALIEENNQIVLGTASDHVYIPSTSVNHALTVDGTISSQGNVLTSDYRIKDDVITLTNRTVDGLRPVAYVNNITGKQDIGLIAHELQEFYPELVNGIKDGEKTQTVNYNGLVGVLISEIQTLKSRLNKIESELKIKQD